MRLGAQERVFRLARLASLTACVALTSALLGCGKPQSSTPPPEARATPSVQRTFASPEEAGAALLDAAKSADRAGLAAIFGTEGQGVLLSGDTVKDTDALQDFVAAYEQMHRWREIQAGGEMLYVGADNFLFPIPLGKNAQGQWQFDTAAGKDEVLARRIGRDELTAIAACAAAARAEDEYFTQTHDGGSAHQYAQKFVSDAGKQNGLYWPAAPGQVPSPLAGVGDFAKAAGYTNAGTRPQPFNGYYFRILTGQGAQAKGGATGGFAILAYPVEYRDSGIMTFIVGPDGVVYQKDLGDSTAALAPTLNEYNPADGWQPASG
jgi:Protein of unknown function (DUF2950)